MPRNEVSKEMGLWVKEIFPEEMKSKYAEALRELENGVLILQILKLLMGENFIKQKATNSDNMTSNRVVVWSNIVENLSTLNIRISVQDKGKLVNGDAESAIRLLKQLKEIYERQHLLRKKANNEVDISKIDPRRELNSATSLLELLILALVKTFSITSKEAVSLLSGDAKYLAHILAKGMKGDFLTVENLYQELAKNIEILSRLSTDKQSREFLFKAVKPGIISKSEKISLMSFDLVSRLVLNYYPQQLRIRVFKELILNTAILGIRRHLQLGKKVAEIMIKIWESYEILLQVVFDNCEEEDSLQLCFQIYKVAVENRQNTQIIKVKEFQKLLRGSFSELQKQLHVVSNLQLISKVLKENPELFIKEDMAKFLQRMVYDFPNNSINNNKNTRHYISFLFGILSVLGEQKNALAPHLYRNLVELIPDFLAAEEIGPLYFDNLVNIITEFPTIPIGLIIDTFTKAYQSQEESIFLDLTHMNLLKAVTARQIRLQSVDFKVCLPLLNLLTKIVLNNVMHAEEVTELICKLLERFSGESLVYDIINKFIKVGLAIFYANERKVQPRRKALIPGKPIKESSMEILYRLKNAVIVKVLSRVIGLGIEEINEGILPLISYTIIQVKAISHEKNELLMRLLRYFGKPQDVIKIFEEAQNSTLQQQMPLNNLSSVSKKGLLGVIKNNNNLKTEEALENYPRKNLLENNSNNLLSVTNNSSHTKISELITPKVLKGLEKYHNSYLRKIEKQESEEKQKVEEISKWQNTKKSMEMKLLQQGLSIKSDQQIDLLFEFDSREKILKLERPHGHSREILYIDAEFEEDRDIKALEYVMKRYHKALRSLYVKYSNSARTGIALRDFDEANQKNQSIKAAELWKMFKDYDFEEDRYLTVYECQEIVKNVNYRLNNKTDPLSLDYSGFQKFMIQVSNFMFSKPPKDLRNYPPSIRMEEMFKMFREKSPASQQQLFDDPDTAYFSEGEVIRDLNKKLTENPNLILPQGYKKIIQNKVEFDYKIVLDILSPTYRDVYEILDEILNDAFNFHLIEPISKSVMKAKARPTLFYVNEKKEQRSDSNNKRAESQKIIRLSNFMKTQVSKFPIKERITATKVATVLEQILVAVEFGHDRTGVKIYENSAVKAKKEKEEEERKKQEEGQKKRRQRQEQLKKQIQELKGIHTSKQRQQLEKKKQLQNKKNREEEEKRKIHEKQLKLRLQEYEKKKKEKEENEKKQQQEKRQKEHEENLRRRKEVEQAKKKVQELKKKKEQEELQKKQIEEAQKKKKKAYEQKLFREKQKLLKQKINEHKKDKKMNIQNENTENEKHQGQNQDPQVKALDS